MFVYQNLMENMEKMGNTKMINITIDRGKMKIQCTLSELNQVMAMKNEPKT